MTAPSQEREIIYLIGSLQRGGAELHLVRLAPALQRLGWKVTIFCLSRCGELATEAEAAGITVVAPPVEMAGSIPRVFRLLALLASACKFFGFILWRRPFAVHLFLPTAYWIGAPLLLLAGIRWRLMSRRSRNHYFDNAPLARSWEGLLHRHMTVILANSRKVMADLIAEGAEESRLRLIYNGTALTDAGTAAAARTATRRELQLDNRLVIACLANLIPYKGHADLIAALIAVHSRLPANWLLLVVGRDDGIGPALLEQAKTGGIANHIRFMGSRNDSAALLTASDAFVLASHQEGFSNAIIEAMAAGLAVIATDVGGNSEAIEDGVSGIIVPPRDPAQLGSAIETLAGDAALRRRLGNAARQRVAATFSFEASLQNYDVLYRSLN